MPPAISGSARINANDTDRLVAWLVRRGLEGMAEPELLPLFCEKCNAAGLAVNRALMFMDTLHPVHEGRIFRWRNDGETEDRPVLDYGPSNQGEAAASWQRSPFFHLLHLQKRALRFAIARRRRSLGQAIKSASGLQVFVLPRRQLAKPLRKGRQFLLPLILQQ